jgi:hypothetical protein
MEKPGVDTWRLMAVHESVAFDESACIADRVRAIEKIKLCCKGEARMKAKEVLMRLAKHGDARISGEALSALNKRFRCNDAGKPLRPKRNITPYHVYLQSGVGNGGLQVRNPVHGGWR